MAKRPPIRFDRKGYSVDPYSFAPIAAVLDGAYLFVSSLSSLLDPIAGPASAALSVILVTAIVRLILLPVGVSQARAELMRRRLAPRLRDLQRRYKANPDLLRRKTLELYTSEKASPLAGCLPTLLQAPVVSTVYGLFILADINGHANALLVEQLYGVPLGTSLMQALATGAPASSLAVFAVLVAVLAAVAFLSRRIALGQAGTEVGTAPPAVMGISSWLPFLTVVFSAVVPLAATLYLTVTTAWTLTERTVLRRMLS